MEERSEEPVEVEEIPAADIPEPVINSESPIEENKTAIEEVENLTEPVVSECPPPAEEKVEEPIAVIEPEEEKSMRVEETPEPVNRTRGGKIYEGGMRVEETPEPVNNLECHAAEALALEEPVKQGKKLVVIE